MYTGNSTHHAIHQTTLHVDCEECCVVPFHSHAVWPSPNNYLIYSTGHSPQQSAPLAVHHIHCLAQSPSFLPQPLILAFFSICCTVLQIVIGLFINSHVHMFTCSYVHIITWLFSFIQFLFLLPCSDSRFPFIWIHFLFSTSSSTIASRSQERKQGSRQRGNRNNEYSRMRWNKCLENEK